MSEKRFCDRCNKEIKKGHPPEDRYRFWINMNANTCAEIVLDICQRCYEDFTVWQKAKVVYS